MRNLYNFLHFFFLNGDFYFPFIDNSYISWGAFRAFQGLCINEFSGLEFDHQQPFDIQTGEQVKGGLLLLF